MIDFNKLDSQCKNCKKLVNRYDIFTGVLCLNCYEKVYSTLSEKEKTNILETLNKAVII